MLLEMSYIYVKTEAQNCKKKVLSLPHSSATPPPPIYSHPTPDTSFQQPSSPNTLPPGFFKRGFCFSSPFRNQPFSTVCSQRSNERTSESIPLAIFMHTNQLLIIFNCSTSSTKPVEDVAIMKPFNTYKQKL